MLAKWIRCTVATAQKPAFGRMQEHWRRLADVPGFLFQIGGWNLKNEREACILGLWEDETSYAAFMRDIHDGIIAGSGEDSAYETCVTELFDVMFRMEGCREDWAEAFATAERLRVARCIVRPEHKAHFVDVQKTVWEPGMRAAGMTAGLFAEARIAEKLVYLVASAWPAVESHEGYMANALPQLRQQAQVERDAEELQGSAIRLERWWAAL